MPPALPAHGPAARPAATEPGPPHAHPEQQTHPFPRVRGTRAVLYEGYSVYEVTPCVHGALRRLPRTHSVVYNVIPRAECYGPHKVFCATVLQAVQAQAAMVCATTCATACATAVRRPLPGLLPPGTCAITRRLPSGARSVGGTQVVASRQYVWLHLLSPPRLRPSGGIASVRAVGCRAVLQTLAAGCRPPGPSGVARYGVCG